MNLLPDTQARARTLEGSRFNEFAYWRRVEAKVAEKLPAAAPPAAAELPAQLPAADNRVEAAQ